jgi:hypothetical protein
VIIGAIIFGVYYFAVSKPRADELEAAKQSAMSQINSNLASIGTSQASAAALDYAGQVRAADSKSEVSAILVEVTYVAQREQKREELLDEVDTATDGTFYSFPELASSLRSEINAKATLGELESYEQAGTIRTQATSKWENLHISVIGGLSENEVVMRRRDSPNYIEYMSRENAILLVHSLAQANSWSVLRELKFENTGSYAVPIVDTFQRVPTVKPGSVVDIYVYDYSTDNLSPKVLGTTVQSVIYPKEELGTIAWTLSDGTTSYSYSTNVWEAIKAATAGDSEAASISWANYAGDVIENASSAGLGNFDLQAIYVIKVPGQSDAQELTQYEQYMSSTKDLILVAQI